MKLFIFLVTIAMVKNAHGMRFKSRVKSLMQEGLLKEERSEESHSGEKFIELEKRVNQFKKELGETKKAAEEKTEKEMAEIRRI